MKYNVYQHLNENKECVYVGLTKNMEYRQNEHLRTGKHKQEIKTIIYAPVKSKTEMEIYEKYYINKLSPKYNVRDNRSDDLSALNLEPLVFKHYKDVTPEDLKKQHYSVDKATIDECKALIESFETHTKTGLRNKALCSVLLATGMKVSEGSEMVYENLDGGNNTYTLEDRELYIPPHIIEMIEEINGWFGHNNTGYIFTTTMNTLVSDSYLRRMIKEQGELVGVNNCNLSIFRRAYTMEVSKYVDARELQRLLGVKDINLILKYLPQRKVDMGKVLSDAGIA